MNSKLLPVCLALASTCVASWAQINSDAIGIHDLSRGGGSSVSGSLGGSCSYCHAAHSSAGAATPLWNQKLSTQTYSTYTSTTNVEKGLAQPVTGSDSALCLSCHDGSVAPGQTVAYGKIAMSGGMKSADVFGNNLTGSHLISMATPLKDSPDLAAGVASNAKTLDTTGAVKMIKGNVECTSCHNPHIQSIDKVAQNFLAINSVNGAECLACHDPARVTTNQVNPLAQWSTSAHAMASNATTSSTLASVSALGSYHTVAQNACSSCHAVHNAPGKARLLRGANEQDCISCHSGGSTISPAISNVYAEFSKIGHPFPNGNNQHDAAESTVLNQNRHATCVDCHNAHSSNQVLAFTAAPVIRGSQNNVAGISSSDGITVVAPAVNQYENCLRCHGSSTGKVTNPIYGYLPVRVVAAGDPLNLIPQFSLTATSSHPVTHDSNSPLPQPSLRAAMLNLDGATPGRSTGVRILCTDCHNSDDNREAGGSGPNGPHGSKFGHIMERRYEISQAAGAGQNITNLFPNPDTGVNGPYALCGKCHNLSQILANTSFSEHARHIKDGFSCSVCHTSHGMGAASGNISGERLVNFDANVVASNGGKAIAYSRAANTCTLSCHGHAHPTPAPATPVTGTKTPAINRVRK